MIDSGLGAKVLGLPLMDLGLSVGDRVLSTRFKAQIDPSPIPGAKAQRSALMDPGSGTRELGSTFEDPSQGIKEPSTSTKFSSSVSMNPKPKGEQFQVSYGFHLEPIH